MKANKLLMFLMIVLLSAPFIASAQDAATTAPKVEEKTFTLSGSIDTYAHTSLGTQNASGMYAPTTSFANLRGFGLGMFNLIGSYQGEKVGFTADVVFGPRGYDAVFNNGYTSQRIVNQLFAYYKISDAFTLNLGQFNTFLGYEVISPAINFHYSTSYLFSYGPFNHTGLRLDYASEGGFVAKLAIMNPTDAVEFNPVNTYTAGLQIGFTNDKGGIWFNGLVGDQDGKLDEDVDAINDESNGMTVQFDLTTGWNLTDAFYLGLNTSLQTRGVNKVVTATGVENVTGADPSSFFGVAVYPKLTLSESFALGLRGEYFSIKNTHITPTPIALDAGDGSVIALTLSGNYKVGGLTIIPEVRVDKTSEDSYTNKEGEAKDLMPSLTLAAVYKF